MRVKTDVRRQAIIEAAAAVFREMGYERASMAAISARVGGSKATLYGYFRSKEDLYAAAMADAVEEQSDALIDLLDPSDPDIHHVLTEFGAAMLALVTSSDVLAIVRTAMADGAASALGGMLYDRGPGRVVREIANYLERLKADGRFRAEDTNIAAIQLKALIEAVDLEPRLYGAAPLKIDRSHSIDLAVAVFLRGYGLDKG